MDRLQHGEWGQRSILDSTEGLYRVAVFQEGLIDEEERDGLARCMQELWEEGLIQFGARRWGRKTPRPAWDWKEIQRFRIWTVTPEGHQEAGLLRTKSVMRVSSDSTSPQEHDNFQVDRPSDIFISHASEDKEDVARPLAGALIERGWSVWLDELELTVGDSLTRRIDQALARSRFGVVILSHAFFSKQWTERELAGLTAREVQSGTKVILPVWHEIDKATILQFSPTLADRLGALTANGIDHVSDQLSRALKVADARPSASSATERVVQSVPDPDSAPPASQSSPETSDKTAAMIALARVLLDKGDVLAAETYLRQAVDAGDSHAMALLGVVVGEHGRREESANLLRQAVDAGRTEALAPLGLVLHELGQLDEAEEVLRKAATG